MIKKLDDFLNGITMYKLVLYYLIGLVAVAAIFSFFGILSFSPLSIFVSTAFLLIVGLGTNILFAEIFGATANIESAYISVLILVLIITPPQNIHDLPFLFWAAVWTMAGKYIFAFRNRHIFNPVALGVFLPSLFLQHSASWWVGTLPMLLPVMIGGLLVIRKIKREQMAGTFILTATLTIMALNFFHGPDILVLMRKIFGDTAILFFAFTMLTEPLTTPPTKDLRIYYAMLIGFLFPPQIHLGSIYTTPEIALLMGNVFSYFVSSKERLTLKLIEKRQIAQDVYDFIFSPDHRFNFIPGQYLEWTLTDKGADSRGNRRYFTIASSPTESDLRIGVKFYPNSSTYKTKLLSLNPGETVTAASLAGDFTLPKNPSKKLVFIAGGIGITPFRSIFKYLIDSNQKRDIVLMYANKIQSDIAYQDLINEVFQKFGIKTIYILSEQDKVPVGWPGKVGRITSEMIAQEIPDYKDRTFYISGPHSMVDAYVDVLKKMKVATGRIVIDYFPGFA